MFVSLPLPESLVEDLDQFCEPRRDADELAARSLGGRSDWSWTLPAQWHLTLAFAGDVPADRLGPWEEGLAEVAERTRPLDLAVRGAGAFPNPDRAKVLHLHVADRAGGSDALAGLARAVRTASQRAGVECDGQRFVPHLTLARSRRGVSATRWLRVFDEVVLPPWPVDGFDLVESQWDGAGNRAVHRVESHFRFGPTSHRPT